jgi:adenosylcobyric acid synthase
MTQTILVAGTASHVGKSTIAAGLCRLLADRGHSVAPYKAQNMSNNARVVVTPTGEWGEIGVSQYVQATAAEMTPTTDTNPVLLKPRGDGESQLVFQGEAVDHFEAGTYYEDYWERAREVAVESYNRLAADADVVVAEGAGSIAEINLHDRDLANVETATFADADILLVADIERGGAFASLYGTLELMPESIRDQVQGAILTKFRGDASLLQSGIAEIEDRTGVPIVGVVPHDDPGLPEEDSVSLPDKKGTRIFGDEDGIADENAVTVAVPRLPHISNFTDMEPLKREPGVRVAYVALDATLDDADAVVLPGSKNTVDDLRALQDAGFDDAIREFDGPIVGLCGGYQMLGQRILNADIESTEAIDAVDGIGLLPVETTFSTDKRLEQVTVPVSGTGLLDGASGTVSGYEIHMGRSEAVAAVDRPLGDGSAATETVLGTYIHGLFENETARTAFLTSVFTFAGKTRPLQQSARASPYEQARTLVADHVDLAPFGL